MNIILRFVPQAQLSLSRADERGTELAGLREEVERCRATAQKTEVGKVKNWAANAGSVLLRQNYDRSVTNRGISWPDTYFAE